jgi:S1-C subfamily serine protease
MTRHVRELMRGVAVAAVGLSGAFLTPRVHAQVPTPEQPPARVAKEDAVLVVDGVVRQVFRSPRQTRTDVLVQIEVQRADARRVPKTAARPQFPAPGEFVYVHVFQRAGVAGLVGNEAGKEVGKADSYSAVPAERAQVRAYLVPRESGVWEGTYPDWFDQTADKPATASKADPAPSVPEAPPTRAALADLGLTIEPSKVKDKLALRVVSVERGGPAQQAGLEAGDVIIGVRGEELKSADQLAEAARRGEPIPVVVLDVHTGRAAQVELRPKPKAADPAKPDPQPAPSAPPAAPPRSLGIAAEPVTVGQRTALKVTRVEPDSPAAKAGLEPGDVLVAANGAAITGPEQLGNAIRKSGPTLTLTVRDSRTGRDVPVEVALGGPKPEKPLPAEVPAAAGAKGKLGAVTELAFYDIEAAVRVTEVEPGSPAAKAGLQPGILILQANGKSVLHPDELNDAARKSTGTLKLTVVDPRTGKKGTVDVNMGQ